MRTQLRLENIRFENSAAVFYFLGLVPLFLIGCGKPQFSSDQVLVTRLSSEIGEPVSEVGLQQIEELLTSAFGSPDLPVVPSAIPGHLVSIEKIRRAAGPVFSDEKDMHFGLYRKHCVRCHGVTGDGKGPAARLLDPYPRDFRLGKFKFKSTPIGTKPTRLDLARILRTGIPGTSMPSFRLLKDEDLEALIDYVIYLTSRGETERSLMNQLTLVEANDPTAMTDYLTIPSQTSGSVSEVSQQLSDTKPELNEKLVELVTVNYQKWDVPPVGEVRLPLDMPIVHSDFQLETSASSSTPSFEDLDVALQESIQRGEVLFRGSVASCSRCHTISGVGETQVVDYDDWTKSWTSTAGIDLKDKSTFAAFIRAGALKPTPISSRDLRHGVFRGGNRPDDIFRRIVYGIEGTTMPAAAVQPDVPGGLSERQVWDLVNYCLSLKGQVVSDITAFSGDRQ